MPQNQIKRDFARIMKMGCSSEMIVKQIYGTTVEGNENRKFAGRHARKCLAPRSATRSKFSAPDFTIIRILPTIETEPKPRKVFRNPMLIALERAEELKRDGISRAELARRHGMSRARFIQWLSLLDLPRLEIERVLAMGDYWDRRLVTERGLRNRTSVASTGVSLA